MRVLWAAFLKEALEAIRDRRSLLMAMVIPLLMPMMTFGIVNFLISKESTSRFDVAVIGIESAPGLRDLLESSRVDLAFLDEGADDIESLLNDFDTVVVIDADFVADFEAMTPAQITLWYDTSRSTSSSASRLMRGQLNRIESTVYRQRLLARGVNSEMLNVIDIDSHDTAHKGSRSAIVMGSMPGMIIFAAFACALATAIDTTSGERERLSLEPLLMQPMSTFTLMTSKWLVVTLFGWIGASLTAIVLHIVMSNTPLYELGMSWQVGVGDLVVMTIVLLPVAMLAAGIMLLVSLSAKSFKEAQTLLGILQIVPLIALMAIDISQAKVEGGLALIPLVAQQKLIKGALTGSYEIDLMLLLGTLITFILGVLFVYAAAKVLSRPHRLLSN